MSDPIWKGREKEYMRVYMKKRRDDERTRFDERVEQTKEARVKRIVIHNYTISPPVEDFKLREEALRKAQPKKVFRVSAGADVRIHLPTDPLKSKVEEVKAELARRGVSYVGDLTIREDWEFYMKQDYRDLSAMDHMNQIYELKDARHALLKYSPGSREFREGMAKLQRAVDEGKKFNESVDELKNLARVMLRAGKSVKEVVAVAENIDIDFFRFNIADVAPVVVEEVLQIMECEHQVAEAMPGYGLETPITENDKGTCEAYVKALREKYAGRR